MLAMLLRRAALVLAGLLLSASLQAAAAGARVQFRGMSLEQAIAALEQRGLVIVYSSAFVKPWMRIRAEPTALEPARVLEELLAPFGLRAQRGPNAIIAIVRAAVPETAPLATRDVQPLIRLPEQDAAPQPLEQVVVAASRYELTRSLSTSLTSLSGADIENLPDIGEDALRAIARLPGAASNGISARTNMRGGEAEENLMRFDGVRLYSPFHLKDFQSLFSAIDPRIVSSVDVYTGGFAARFGDRMSSVVDITSLAPPAPLYRELNVSFLNTSALGAGRFAEDRGEWLASFRRGNLDVWYHALSHEPGTPSYADAFAKVSYRLSERTKLTASALFFTDEISLSAEDEEERANAEYSDKYLWARLDQQPNAHLTGSTLLAHTHLRSGRAGFLDKDGVASGTLADQRSFDIDSLQTDWSWRARENWLVLFGGDLRFARGRYDYRDQVEFDLLFDTPGAANQASRARAIRVEPQQTEYALYGNFRYGVTPRLTTDVGVRWEGGTASPRLGVRYEIGTRTTLRASWARMTQSQSIDELQVSDGVNAFFPPQRTDHTSLAIEHRLPNGVTLRAELYDKRQRHLRPRFENLLDPFTLIPELNPDRIMLAPEYGRSRGVEVLAAKSAGALTWWLGYSRSTAKERQEGVDVFRRWNQTHALSAGMNWSTERWNVGIGLIQHSGWPTTAVSLERSEPVPIVFAGPRNSARTALYRSVDARVARSYALDHSALTLFLEVANVLGRDNPCCSAYEIDDETGGLELERRNSVPRIPSLGFLWQF